MERLLRGGRVEAVGDRPGVLDQAGEVELEPLLDVAVDQTAGENEQEQGGDEGQGGEEDDKLGLEMRADDLALALEVELDQVAAEDEKEDQGQEQDDELEGGQQDAGDLGRGELGRAAEKKSMTKKRTTRRTMIPPMMPGAPFLPRGLGLRPSRSASGAPGPAGSSSWMERRRSGRN